MLGVTCLFIFHIKMTISTLVFPFSSLDQIKSINQFKIIFNTKIRKKYLTWSSRGNVTSHGI